MWLFSGAWGHPQPCLFQLRPPGLLHQLMIQDTMSPPELPGPAPARPQQVWTPSPCSPAMPSYACKPKSQPGLSQALMPGKCLVPQGAAAALVPCTMGWHRLWLPGPALTNPWGWTCQPLQGPDSYTQEFGIFWKLFTEKIAGMVGYLSISARSPACLQPYWNDQSLIFRLSG